MKQHTRHTLFLAYLLIVVAFTLFSFQSSASNRGLAATEAATVVATAPALPHWEYEGEDGPMNWGALDTRYATCSAGREQSPINITKAQKLDLVDVTFKYTPSALNIFNNGHTIQVNYDAGSSIVYNEMEYKLLQFHFHHPSEHTVDGKAFALELHFVHQNTAGNLAVVGVLIEKSDKDNMDYASIFDNLPTTAGTPQSTTKTIDAAKLLPATRLYDTYVGSLTTPPCTEGVRWLVITTPISLSETQIEKFSKIFELNARPVQPLNTRDLLEDNTASK